MMLLTATLPKLTVTAALLLGGFTGGANARLHPSPPQAQLVEQNDGSSEDGLVVRRLEHPGGGEFHRTANPVRDLRTIEVPGGDGDESTSRRQLYLWKEDTPEGHTQSFYAVGSGASANNDRRLVGRVRETDNKVRLRGVQFDPLSPGGQPDVPPGWEMRPNGKLFLTQLETTPLPEMRDDITNKGAKIHRFLADHTFIVEMPSPQIVASVRRLPYVRWVGPYHAAYKVDTPSSSTPPGNSSPIFERDLKDDEEAVRYSIMVCERGRPSQKALEDVIINLGGSVELIEPGGWRVEAMLTTSQKQELAHSDLVQFIDEWGGPGEVDMNVVRTVGGANYIETIEGFTGQGVRGEIFDTELLTTHQEWNHVPTVHSSSTSCSSNHGTSCYSNNFAQGIDNSARGVIPDGTGIFFCYTEATQFGGSKSRYDMNAELIHPNGPYRAVFQTSSVGSSRTFFYTTLSADTDDYLFRAQILSTQSQSNAGNQDSRPQAWAKNIVSVGGIRHLNDLNECNDYHGSGGSTGPAEDGRVKPDLAFFYDSIQSASGSGTSSYTGFGGTSSATPQTSGYFGLLFQMWHEGVWAGHGGGADVFDSRCKMSTAKALMINSAYSYDWTNAGGCSYSDLNRWRQGWGRPNAQTLYDQAPKTRVIDETDIILPLGTKTYSYPVEAGEPVLRITMVYTDPAGTVGASVNRINDLSLKVTSPSNVVYYGNNGLTTGLWSTSGGSSNTIDTVENVFIESPEGGTWKVEVLGDEIVQDGYLETGAIDAVFALVVYGVNPTPTISPVPTSSSVPTDAPSFSLAPSDSPTAKPTPAPTIVLPVEPTITATYDGTCPKCDTVGGACTSGPDLLNSRGTMTTAEPNQSNTIDNCSDGNSGSYHNDESCDAIEVSAVAGGLLQVGRWAVVKATVWAWSTGSSDTADFYVTDNVNNPNWVHIDSIVPPSGGLHVLTSKSFELKSTLQAVRVNFRYNGSRGHCTTGGYDDRDDLVFAVSPSGPVTPQPTGSPTKEPTNSPTKEPTNSPSKEPTNSPSKKPTASPTLPSPTKSPTDAPTNSPSKKPTSAPTESPVTPSPTMFPTDAPTTAPSKKPTSAPTESPVTPSPTMFPTDAPTNAPSKKPTSAPTGSPVTSSPTIPPTQKPTSSPISCGVNNDKKPDCETAGCQWNNLGKTKCCVAPGSPSNSCP